jgi:hypothetical protein
VACFSWLSRCTEEEHPRHLQVAASLVPPSPLLQRNFSTLDLCHTLESDILPLETDLEGAGQTQKLTRFVRTHWLHPNSMRKT